MGKKTAAPLGDDETPGGVPRLPFGNEPKIPKPRDQWKPVEKPIMPWWETYKTYPFGGGYISISTSTTIVYGHCEHCSVPLHHRGDAYSFPRLDTLKGQQLCHTCFDECASNLKFLARLVKEVQDEY